MAVAMGTVGLLFIWTRFRLKEARRRLAGPYRKVWAVGWSRPPDGCNYALFEGQQMRGDRPDWVLRLPTVKAAQSRAAFLCGEIRPGNITAGNALIGQDGSLLAAGRIVAERTGQRKWQRRSARKSRWVGGG